MLPLLRQARHTASSRYACVDVSDSVLAQRSTEIFAESKPDAGEVRGRACAAECGGMEERRVAAWRLLCKRSSPLSVLRQRSEATLVGEASLVPACLPLVACKRTGFSFSFFPPSSQSFLFSSYLSPSDFLLSAVYPFNTK